MFDLPTSSIPTEIMPGVRGHVTSTGVTVLRVHYWADPARRSPEWLDMQLAGYRGGREGRDWAREMEISFDDYAGAAVFNFSPDSIVSTAYNKELPLYRGWDFGYRHPAVTWFQLWPDDTLTVLHELYPTLDATTTPGVSVADLGRMVTAHTTERFPAAARSDGPGISDWGDPSGAARKDTSEFSAIEQLSHQGIDVSWVSVGRKNRIAYLRRYVDRPGGLRIDPHCTLLIRGLSGAYRYPEDTAVSRDTDMPDLSKKVQNEPYIHLIDSMEYFAAGVLATDYTSVESPWNNNNEPTNTVFGTALDAVAQFYSPQRLAIDEPAPEYDGVLEQDLEWGF